MKKGILIYPPNQLMDIETPRPDGSLGLLYLASALEERGIQADVLDATVGTPTHSLEETFYRNIKQENGLVRIGMNFEEIADYVLEGEYNFVGINSNFSSQTSMAIKTAKAIKERNPFIPVFAGGINARALKERFLSKVCYFNAICLTDGELIIPRLISEDIRNVPGVAFLADGKIQTNPIDSSCFPKLFDSLPVPAWYKLPLNKYELISSPHGVDLIKGKHKYAPIMTSRGCGYSCLYCHNSTERTGFRIHSVHRVQEEITILKLMGIKRLFFEDDNLFAFKHRIRELAKLVSKYKMHIANTNGVNINSYYKEKSEIDEDFIETIRSMGFEQIVFPVESGSQRILKKYASNKVRLDKMDLTALMKKLTEYKILAPINMMIGFPDETEKEIQSSIDLAKRLMDAGAPYCTFFAPIPFPGSKLFDMALDEGYLDKDFDPDMLNWKRPIMKNTVVSAARLEEIRDKATEEVNTKEHLTKRLEQSMRHRWTK